MLEHSKVVLAQQIFKPSECQAFEYTAWETQPKVQWKQCRKLFIILSAVAKISVHLKGDGMEMLPSKYRSTE